MSIRKAALRIKDQILINDGRNNNPDKQANYDKAVANAKNKLSIKLKSIKVDPKNSLEMFDMWLLSNINYINKDGKITSPHMQSIRKKQGREWKKKDIKGNIDPWGTSQQVYVEPISSSSTSNSAIRKMQKELNAYRHNGFWQPMDTIRDKQILNDLWESNNAPWIIWEKQNQD